MPVERPETTWLALCEAIGGKTWCGGGGGGGGGESSAENVSTGTSAIVAFPYIAPAAFLAVFVGLFYLGQGGEALYEFLYGNVVVTRAGKLRFEADKGVTKFNVARGARVWLGDEKGVVLKVFTRGYGSGAKVRVQLEGFLSRKRTLLSRSGWAIVACALVTLVFVFPGLAGDGAAFIAEALALAAATCTPSYVRFQARERHG